MILYNSLYVTSVLNYSLMYVGVQSTGGLSCMLENLFSAEIDGVFENVLLDFI
jgi:hypothetical protein